VKPNSLFGICPDDEEVKKLSPWFMAWYGYMLGDLERLFQMGLVQDWNQEIVEKKQENKKQKKQYRQVYLEKFGEIDFRKSLSLLWNRRKEIIKSIRPKALIFRQTCRLTIYHAYKLPSDNPFIILSRPYGVPYIPASSVKGVVRFYFYMLGEMMGYSLKNSGSNNGEQDSNTSEGKKNDFQMLIDFIFGKGGENNATRGNVIFWDAVPWRKQDDYRLLDVDIINNHFRPYYRDDKGLPPFDVYSPKPVYFITVRKGTYWHFAFEVLSYPDGLEKLIAEIRDFLKEEVCVSELVGERYSLDALLGEVMKWGLKTFGIGAKTRVGYGRMEYERFGCRR